MPFVEPQSMEARRARAAAEAAAMLADLARYRPGMEAQLAAFRAALADGMPRRGWKVGINVPEVLASLGLRHSAVGWLDGRRLFRSGERIPSDAAQRLHVEPELCLVVREGISSQLGPEEALARIAGVAPALELVDYARPAAGLDAIVAHSMFHAGLVVGGWQPLERGSGLGREWPVLQVASGEPVRPRHDLVPDDLGALVRFVAAFLEPFGQALEPGDLILSGSYAERAVALPPGSRARAEFGPLGSVEVSRRP